VKEDLFMHSSCIEHFVIRAKLMDLNELELIGVCLFVLFIRYSL